MADPDRRPDLAVVVGASGGIGRALARRLVDTGGHDRVVALSRSRPTGWADDARQVWMHADLLDEASLATAAAEIPALGAPTRIVIASGRLHGPGLTPEKSMRSLDLTRLTELFAVNAAGPALVAKHLLPLMPRDRPSLFAALSARVGSISDNRLGGWYGYRASKAALNMLMATLAIEHRRTHPLGVCVALHPGTVETPLSAPFRSAARGVLTPDQSAEALVQVMDGLTPADTGRFLAWDGSAIEW